jgi:hypothetical protein
MPVRSFGQGSMVRGQTDPNAVRQLLDSAGTGIRTIRKVGPKKMFLHPKLPDQKQVKRIIEEVGSHEDRVELNLYIVGETGGEEEGAQAEGGQE